MKYLLFAVLLFPATLFSVSCRDNTAKKQSIPEEDSLPGKSHYVIDTPDVFSPYIVKSDKSYFFDYPDSMSKRTDFLAEGEFLNITATSNTFGYANHPVSGDSSLTGWVLLSTLEPIRFTPPKVVSEDPEK